jgi:hypothetical protein
VIFLGVILLVWLVFQGLPGPTGGQPAGPLPHRSETSSLPGR